MKIKSLLSLVLFLVTHSAVSDPLVSPDSDYRITQIILSDINNYRISKGLNPLKLNNIISEQARQHSVDMSRHRISFGHQYFNDRIKRIYAKIPHCRAGAENVAYNYPVSNIVKEWIKSPGHKQNIIGHYNLTGIGIARDNRGKLYYTQLFIKS